MSKKHKVRAAAVGQSSSGTEDSTFERAQEIKLTDDDIAERAYSYWESRGCQGGSADEDWYRAIEELTEERQR